MFLCRRILTSPSSPAVFSKSPFYSSNAGARSLLKVGDFLREARRFSAADVAAYAAASGDHNPVHSDPLFAREIAGFDGGCVVHGMLVASIFPAVIASYFPGAVYVSQNLQFKLPVYIEDQVVAEIQAINLREHKKKFMVKFTTKCFLDQRNLAVDGDAIAILPALMPSK